MVRACNVVLLSSRGQVGVVEARPLLPGKGCTCSKLESDNKEDEEEDEGTGTWAARVGQMRLPNLHYF